MANASTLSIPELMEEAELEILSQSQIRRTSSPFDTPGRGNFEGISGAWTPGWNGDGNSRAPAAASTPYMASRAEKNPPVPGRWGKIEWRHLERCFVYERRALAQEMGYASSKNVGPEVVNLDEVVGRFVEGVADDELEGEWAW